VNKEIEALVEKAGLVLSARQITVVTAESCTGGGLGFCLTSIAGSSAWYERGFTTYSNAAKEELLNVNPDTLEQFGAVSEQTACEMAEGALVNSHADVSIAITGIAGPDGGSKDKPVGTVWIAYAGKNLATKAYVDIFPGDREAVRLSVIQRALEKLIDYHSC
jgi:nicotinamide-nucleotide amidase